MAIFLTIFLGFLITYAWSMDKWIMFMRILVSIFFTFFLIEATNSNLIIFFLIIGIVIFCILFSKREKNKREINYDNQFQIQSNSENTESNSQDEKSVVNLTGRENKIQKKELLPQPTKLNDYSIKEICLAGIPKIYNERWCGIKFEGDQLIINVIIDHPLHKVESHKDYFNQKNFDSELVRIASEEYSKNWNSISKNKSIGFFEQGRQLNECTMQKNSQLRLIKQGAINYSKIFKIDRKDILGVNLTAGKNDNSAKVAAGIIGFIGLGPIGAALASYGADGANTNFLNLTVNYSGFPIEIFFKNSSTMHITYQKIIEFWRQF